MRLLRLALGTMMIAAPMIAAAQSDPSQTSDTSRITATIAQTDALFADYAAANHTPGLIYGIVADGRLVHVRGFGVQDTKAKSPVTADTLFRIASMSKAFTALAILKLRDEGKLALDDLAERYVPQLRGWRYPSADAPRITIRHLLSHVGGFVTDDPWGDRQTPMPEDEFTKLLAAGVPFSRPPGMAYEYSNLGYALLGRIITNVAAEPYDRYIARTILTPLGMTSSGYRVNEAPIERRALGYRWEDGAWAEEPTMAHGAFGAMGGLQTSAADYARYVAWLLSAWPPRDAPDTGPVKRASVRELAEGLNFVRIEKRPGASGASACPLAAAYGKGMIAARDCDLGLTLRHGGGYPGYGSHVMIMPDYGIGIFVFGNKTYNGGTAPVWDTAVALLSSGALVKRAPVISALLAQGYASAAKIYGAGDVSASSATLAMNFLMDRDAAHWAADIAALKAKVGDCQTTAPVTPTGALSGSFVWDCARGKVSGDILLAPTATPQIQALRLTAMP